MIRWIVLAHVTAILLLPASLAAQGADTIDIPALEKRVADLGASGSAPDLDLANRELARALNTVGLRHWRDARYDSAVVHLVRSRDLWAELGDRVWLGRVYNNLGAAHYQWGNYEPALESFLRSLEIRRSLGDERGQALVLTNVGRTYHDWQQYDRAHTAFAEAIVLADAVADRFVFGYALHNLGVLHYSLEDYAAARGLFEASLDFYGTPEDPRMGRSEAVSGWALNMLHLSRIHVREGEYAEAIGLVEDVLAEAVEADHPRRHARALVHLGHAYRVKGDLPAAVETLERAIDVSTSAGQRSLVAEALAELASAYEAQDDYGAALLQYRAHSALRDSIFNQTAVQRIAAMEARAEADRQAHENVRLEESRQVRESVIARQRAVVLLSGALLGLSLILTVVLIRFNHTSRARGTLLASSNAALDRTNKELRAALSEVRTLEGLIPICMHCKKIRDDEGFWEGVETYISNRSDARFSHAICADCGPRHYGEDWLGPQDEVVGVRG